MSVYCLTQRRLNRCYSFTKQTAREKICLRSAYSIRSQHNPLNDLMRILSQQRTYRIGTTISIISVTNNVFLIVFGATRNAPLLAGKTTSAATSAQFCIQDLLDDPLRCLLTHSTLQSLVPPNATISG